MRQPARLAIVALCGGFVLMAGPTYGDSAKEGLRAAKQNILQDVRDDIQRRLVRPTSELKLDKDGNTTLPRRGLGSKKIRSHN